MRACSGIRVDGERCRAQPMRNSQWCLNHDPDRAEANRRRSSKGGNRGGRGRPSVELKKIQHRLEDLAEAVLDGKVDRADASVAGQLLHYARACLRDTLAAREQEDLISRMEELEEALEQQRSRSAYGA